MTGFERSHTFAGMSETTTTPLQLEQLSEALAAENREAIVTLAQDLHYVDLAHFYEELDDAGRDFFMKTIGPEIATDLVAELPDSLIEEALGHFEPAQLSVLLRNLSDDDRVDVFQVVSDQEQVRFFSLLGTRDKELTRSLLKYGEDTAGGRMTTHIGRITTDMTVKQAIAVLKRHRDDMETLARIFVIDAQGRLVGKVRLRELAFSSWDTPIMEIMEDASEFVLAGVDQEEAAQMLAKYDLVVLPVVDEFHHLLGVMTYDDAMEVLEEESTEDLEKLAAISGEQSEMSYLNTGVAEHLRRRVLWLVLLAFISIISGYVLYRFEAVLEQAFVLTLFLPMVVAAGGNAGGQAATMVVRALALGEITPGSALRIAWKEARTGLFLGLALGVSIALFITFILPFFQPQDGGPQAFGFALLATAVSISLTVQVLSATVLGAMLPILARAARLDPAVVSAPSLASIVDVSGMFIYLATASLILGI